MAPWCWLVGGGAGQRREGLICLTLGRVFRGDLHPCKLGISFRLGGNSLCFGDSMPRAVGKLTVVLKCLQVNSEPRKGPEAAQCGASTALGKEC